MMLKSCVYILLDRQLQNQQNKQQLTTMKSIRALCTISLVNLMRYIRLMPNLGRADAMRIGPPSSLLLIVRLCDIL